MKPASDTTQPREQALTLFESIIAKDPQAFQREGETVYQVTKSELLEFCSALTNRQAAPEAPDSEQQARDWTDDAHHENGNYQCLCSTCGNTFIGHKRRLTCKSCATAMASASGRTNASDETGGTVKRFAFDCSGNTPKIIPATNGAFVWYDDYVKLYRDRATAPSRNAAPHVRTMAAAVEAAWVAHCAGERRPVEEAFIFEAGYRAAQAAHAGASAEQDVEYLARGRAIDRAQLDMPDGFEISIQLAKCHAEVKLFGPDGEETDDDFDGEAVSELIDEAIRAAMSAATEQTEKP